MALRYPADFLLHLRESPLCVKPDSLPPSEDWMGAPAEQVRVQAKSVSETRPRTNDNPLLDQTNRTPGLDRHVSRNSSNPEDIVFAPPRMAFASASARGIKPLDGDKSTKDDTQGRFGIRNRSGDLDAGRNNPLRRRGDGDQDSDGWSMVKPRKSFGAEGAERFHGKMGGNFRDEKKPQREKEEREAVRERAPRQFDTVARDREAAEAENRPRNGVTRSKLDPWHKPEANESPAPERKERDRNKSWRDREAEPTDDRAARQGTDTRQGTDARQGADRRWGRDRDQRVEREPEWFDEPAEERRGAHTQQEFQKWLDDMKKSKSAPSAGAPGVGPTQAAQESAKPSVASPPVEAGPDKFFMAFGGSNSAAETPGTAASGESANKAKGGGKSSRFTSFFSQPHEEVRGRTEPSTPLTGPPVNGPIPTAAAVLPIFSQTPGQAAPPEEERQAFQQLLAKLQKQTLTATPPGPSPFAAPPQPTHIDNGKKSSVTSPDPFQQYGNDRREPPMARPHSGHVQEILAPRPQQQSARPEQLLQDLVGHHQRISSQGSGRHEPAARSSSNSNTEFLMNLMRAGPDAQRPGQHHMMGMPQPQPQPQQQQQQQPQPQPQHQHQHHHQLSQKQHQMAQHNDREIEYQMRENRGPPRQMRQQPPPGFPMDDSFHGGDHEPRQNQPTQILQRPMPPPGMDQMPPNWMTGGGQMPPPPQQRGPMIPPPGLAGGPGPGRNVPMPHMFPPNFPPGGILPDAMQGMPPRNMPPPPPGFFNGLPPGFLPPGLGGYNGPPGPESHGFPGSPFEGRGMPPQGNNRGTNYGRP